MILSWSWCIAGQHYKYNVTMQRYKRVWGGGSGVTRAGWGLVQTPRSVGGCKGCVLVGRDVAFHLPPIPSLVLIPVGIEHDTILSIFFSIVVYFPLAVCFGLSFPFFWFLKSKVNLLISSIKKHIWSYNFLHLVSFCVLYFHFLFIL